MINPVYLINCIALGSIPGICPSLTMAIQAGHMILRSEARVYMKDLIILGYEIPGNIFANEGTLEINRDSYLDETSSICTQDQMESYRRGEVVKAYLILRLI